MAVPPTAKLDTPRGTWATGTGTAAALAGIVASSCCVLPLMLAGLGLGGVSLSVLPVLAAWRPYLLGAAVLALALAWILHWRRPTAGSGDAACATGAAARRFPLWLVLASAIVLLELVWQSAIEPRLLLLFE